MLKRKISKIKIVSKVVFVTIVILLIGFSSLHAKRLNAFLSYANFYSPENGPYIETYLTVEGKSANYILNENGKYQAAIQIIMLFKIGDEIINYDKYELNSPELDDTLDINYNFIDQQRYTLANGNYEFEIQIWDKNSDTKPFINLQPLVIDYPDNEIIISGIQLVNSYTKTEDEVIPKVDILYMTRIQQERFADPLEYERVKNAYILRNKMLDGARKNLKILHPLPRVNEITEDVDSNPKAYYFQQAQNGVYVRQALLATIFGKNIKN